MINKLFILFSMLIAVPAMAGGTVVLVVGAEGEPEFGRAFSQWADRWVTTAESSSMRVVQIGRDGTAATTAPSSGPSVTASTAPSTSPATSPATSPVTDKAKIQNILQAEAAEKTEPLWIVLIGHGTSDGRDAKFNLNGPDVTDKELAEWLRPIRRPVAAINCFSASGPFLNRLSGADRVVITAARSGSEIQFSRFGDYLSSAIGGATSDLDKDGQTSLLEAFIAASYRVEEFYKSNGRLATEHALLDDNADGLGVASDWFQGIRATRSAKAGASVDGPRAHQWHLRTSQSEQALRPELRAQRDRMEMAIESLRQKKSTLSETEYYAQLEKLFIELAKVNQQNDQPR